MNDANGFEDGTDTDVIVVKWPSVCIMPQGSLAHWVSLPGEWPLVGIMPS